jgi:transcription antitermination factor NusG
MSGRNGTHREVEPFWTVVKTVPNHDRLALDSVTLLGFETFWPRTRIKVGLKWRTASLFPCYFFARIEEQWRIIARTMGVAGVVKFGPTPARCPDEEIGKLIAHADADGLVRLRTPPPARARPGLRPGVKVLITQGLLAGFDGLTTGMSANQREVILLNILGGPRTVEIAAGALRRAH